jgi:hypothetical protein
MDKLRTAQFEFVVTNLTEKQISSLLDLVCVYLESHNSTLGGGFSFLDVEEKKESENGKA